MATAIVFSAYGGPEVLGPLEIEEPVAGPGEVRVRVRAAGVNPVDVKLRRGDFAGLVPVTFPQRLGNEFAGVIDQVGADVTGFAAGDEVLGFTAMAAYTEVLTVPADSVTGKPDALPWELAGVLSAVGQTACNALRELKVASGDTLLVHAAAGGVGTVAIQLARRLGARVIGTASERNHAYLRALGAEPVVYGDGLAERVRALAPEGVDVVLDAVGGASVDASLELVADRARIGTTVDQKAADEHGIVRLRGARSAGMLAELAGLAARGELVLPIAAAHPLAAAAEAHREVETGHVRGKVVLTSG
ncbi:NADP-dependent oxidoreductase [Streptomyces cinnabarinus]|uniref:NADP-dependent oxidoreductase n=1 Tax=Streptomyces cinnabarinus TaxID=67287 RepID=A0ABY7KM46_9ACTN|nr:NADP-dependent oxidoreductase [Streptomyces cinnabarinus]WAZ24648.1 NADP-dependent oxidoreductase [Streptomyces cinnabarinus]